MPFYSVTQELAPALHGEIGANATTMSSWITKSPTDHDMMGCDQLVAREVLELCPCHVRMAYMQVVILRKVLKQAISSRYE